MMDSPAPPAGFHAAVQRVLACPDPVFFVGTHKNSGKTTAFLRFAQALREEDATPVLFSLGRDGEARDQFFGHEKPTVRVEPGWWLVTREDALGNVPCTLVVPLAARVDGRPLGLFQARACGEVELWGPPAASDLRAMLDAVAALPCPDGRRRILLVDGALDRQAALHHGPAAMVLCCKAGAFSGPAALRAHLALRRRLFDAPRAVAPLPGVHVADGLGERPPVADGVVVDGPLTQSLATDLLRDDATGPVVIASPLHVFTTTPVLERLLPRLFLLDAPDWLGTAIHPAACGGASPPPSAVMTEARAALGPGHPLFDVLAE